MKVKAINSVSFKEILLKIEEMLVDFSPTLAIVYFDTLFDYKSLGAYLEQKEIQTIGTSTCGEICNDQNLSESCSILFLDPKEDHFKIQIEKFEGDEFETAKKIALNAKENFENPALITYASKVGVNGDLVVKGYKEVLGKVAPIFGGLAGDNFRNDEFIVFSNNRFEPNGLVALVFDGNIIKLEGKSYSGWKELGRMHTVTKAQGNILHEIDNSPALEMFVQYFGIEKSTSDDGTPLDVIPGIYPLKVIKDNEAEYLRSPLLYDKKNLSLILAGEVNEGDKFKFCTMPDFETVESTVKYFQKYSNSHQEIDAVVVNTCAARKLAFGPMMNIEIKDIFNIWNVPMAGYMAMGEIGNNCKDDICDFHNVTCSLLTLKEI